VTQAQQQAGGPAGSAVRRLWPDGSFCAEIQAATGEPVSSCFQCKKCTAGCPVVASMDVVPHRMIRLIQMGLRDEVLAASTVWICASCRACEARCPNDINIARVMDYLKARILHSHGDVPERRVLAFHRSFLNAVRAYGRAHEISMIGLFKVRSRSFLDDLAMGGRMLVRGRLPLLPEVIRGRGQIGRIFRRAGELSRDDLGAAREAAAPGSGEGEKA